jgi:hypothetical protein
MSKHAIRFILDCICLTYRKVNECDAIITSRVLDREIPPKNSLFDYDSYSLLQILTEIHSDFTLARTEDAHISLCEQLKLYLNSQLLDADVVLEEIKNNPASEAMRIRLTELVFCVIMEKVWGIEMLLEGEDFEFNRQTSFKWLHWNKNDGS